MINAGIREVKNNLSRFLARGIRRNRISPVEVPGKPVSDMVIEDRR